jgi:hypothetical protein
MPAIESGWQDSRHHPSTRSLDDVGLTDSEHAQSGEVARLSASFAENLQTAVHDGKADAAVIMENLEAAA